MSPEHGDASDGSPKSWRRRIPYLIDARFLNEVQAADDDCADEILRSHVRLLELIYDREGHGDLVLVVASSLINRLESLESRPLFQIARLHGLRASLLLAVGECAQDARAARSDATVAIDVARRVECQRGRRCTAFIAEQQLKAAVALKALDEKDEALHQLDLDRRAWQGKGMGGAALRLERQAALIYQEDKPFERLLVAAPEYAGNQPGEYYRTLKRAFEYRLNNRSLQAAEMLLPAVISAWLAMPAKDKTVLEEVSFEKNLGQYWAKTGQAFRAQGVLTDALKLALAGGLRGQARQLTQLITAIRDGEAPRLPSFSLQA